ncbi:MAG: Glutamate carboxypeptidase II precursor [Cytophagales bacterium]|jgi:N-acetylated-alpha-linked acidic dipeptidase|nr:M28 family peptidase [Bacteroidota bacterium]MBS1980169.1 M28 family peptidase [Bacteroidota bacterium]WHZ08681.1 MAG: Glutamate carboxypeptidase II precursor [Cytophagales bacterium]
MRYIVSYFLLISTGLFAQNLTGFSETASAKQKQTESFFLKLQESERYKNHLKNITKEPHISTSKANERVRDYIADVMRKAGLQVEIFPYDIYLPVMPGSASAELVEPIRILLNNKEYIHKEDPYSADPNLYFGYNAYTGSGDVTAEVVYANFGRKEDFEKLQTLGISVKGKVVIARYGGNFRGYKAKYAEAAGAAALIIFTDPGDSGYAKGLVYPEGPMYNESDIQRGSLLTLDWTGDPLTPFEPALPLDGKKKIVRKKPEEVAGMHNIPVLPLPYGSAKEIIARMTGKPVPAGWQGGLPCTYRLEGGADLKVRVNVQQKREIQRVYDVVGTLVGSEFPNEWVMAGSHYDAWGFGATDPNSGTAMLLALSESLGKLKQAGYAPKRTIKIMHWDAEEQGVIGSTEWVEHFRDELEAKGVAYINADGAVSGKNFGASSSPSLKGLFIESTKVIPYPDSSKSVYDHWLGNRGLKEPRLGNLGGGSDHIAFYTHIGIPSGGAGTGGPTIYHSNHDSFSFYEHFADPTFKMGPLVEQVFGVMALRLANAEVIPYNVARYGIDLHTHLEGLQKLTKAYDKTATPFSFDALLKAADELKQAGEEAEAALKTAKESNRKEINAELLGLERVWIDKQGMPYGNWYRSLYASPDPYSGYASWMLPAFQYEAANRSTTNLKMWESKYLSAISKLKSKLEAITKLAK